MNSTTRTNWTYLTALTIVRCFMLGAAAVSFSHIVTTAHLLGLHGWQAYTTPLAIDGFAALGMLGRSHRFAESTRRVGLRFAVAAGLLSLVANIYAGHNPGERIYGALVVAAFVAAESYADRMRPVEADTSEAPALAALRAELAAAHGALDAARTATAEADQRAAQAAAEAIRVRDEAARAKRSAAALKGVAKRRERLAEADQRAEGAELFSAIARELDPGYEDSVAPTSPAAVGYL